MHSPGSPLCPETMTRSGLRSWPTSTRLVTWENWPPPKAAWGLRQPEPVAQHSHYIFRRLPHGQKTFSLVTSHFLNCATSLPWEPAPQHIPGSPRETQGDLSRVSSSQRPPTECPINAPASAGRRIPGRAAGPPSLQGLYCSVSGIQCPGDLSRPPRTLRSVPSPR